MADAAADERRRQRRVQVGRALAAPLGFPEIARSRSDQLGPSRTFERGDLRVTAERRDHQSRQRLGVEEIHQSPQSFAFACAPVELRAVGEVHGIPDLVVKLADDFGDQPRLRSEAMIGQSDRRAGATREVRQLEVAFACNQRRARGFDESRAGLLGTRRGRSHRQGVRN
jgi:hypothetical protein